MKKHETLMSALPWDAADKKANQLIHELLKRGYKPCEAPAIPEVSWTQRQIYVYVDNPNDKKWAWMKHLPGPVPITLKKIYVKVMV